MDDIQALLVAAYGRSIKSQPSEIANETTELLGVASRSHRGLYMVGARVNPGFFGDIDTVTKGTDGWARPANAELVSRIEQASDGQRVHVVPHNDRDFADPELAVFAWGQLYRDAATPPVGDLDIYFSVRPQPYTTLADTPHSMWPDAFDELWILDVATYLALKDGRESRGDEIDQLREERRHWLRLYIAHLAHETEGEIRRFNDEGTPPLEELERLLAGG